MIKACPPRILKYFYIWAHNRDAASSVLLAERRDSYICAPLVADIEILT